MNAQEIAAAYHNLWRVEESFRTLKSFFSTRPMFHWTAKRISGHIMLNFIALVLEVDLELLLQVHNIELAIPRPGRLSKQCSDLSYRLENLDIIHMLNWRICKSRY